MARRPGNECAPRQARSTLAPGPDLDRQVVKSRLALPADLGADAIRPTSSVAGHGRCEFRRNGIRAISTTTSVLFSAGSSNNGQSARDMGLKPGDVGAVTAVTSIECEDYGNVNECTGSRCRSRPAGHQAWRIKQGHGSSREADCSPVTYFVVRLQMNSGRRRMPNDNQIAVLRLSQWLDVWDEYDFDPGTQRCRPEPYMYLFTMSATRLRHFSDVYSRERDVEQAEGIQRAREDSRTGRIRRYIKAGYPFGDLKEKLRNANMRLRKPGWLPTAIVVADGKVGIHLDHASQRVRLSKRIGAWTEVQAEPLRVTT